MYVSKRDEQLTRPALTQPCMMGDPIKKLQVMARRNLPTRLGLSGKNSDNNGKTQPCFLIIGFTKVATR
jgi:hypothetical protein